MKLMGPDVYQAYSRILRQLRARGETLDLFRMSLAADLALELGRDAPDPEVVRVLRERLGLAHDVVGAEGEATGS